MWGDEVRGENCLYLLSMRGELHMRIRIFVISGFGITGITNGFWVTVLCHGILADLIIKDKKELPMPGTLFCISDIRPRQLNKMKR